MNNSERSCVPFFLPPENPLKALYMKRKMKFSYDIVKTLVEITEVFYLLSKKNNLGASHK